MIIGVNEHMDWNVQSDPAVRLDVLDKMAGWGAKSVRIDYAWDQVEPTKGQYRWSELDQYVSEAQDRDMTVLFMLYWPPTWAVKSGSGKGAVPRDPEEFGQVLGQIGKRYGSRLAGIEMWNEPDLDVFWSGTQEEWIDLIAGAYPVAKELAPDVNLIAASPTYLGLEGWYQNAYEDDRFRPGVSFDSVGIHPYMSPADLPPDAPPSHWSIHGIPELDDLRADHGDNSPLWATEFGWSTHPNTGSEQPWKKGVTEQQQADFYLLALDLLEEYGVAAAYLYTDWNMPGSDPQEANFGLLRDDRSPKPVVAALTEELAKPPTPDDDELQAQIDTLNDRVAALESTIATLAGHLAAASDDLLG